MSAQEIIVIELHECIGLLTLGCVYNEQVIAIMDSICQLIDTLNSNDLWLETIHHCLLQLSDRLFFNQDRSLVKAGRPRSDIDLESIEHFFSLGFNITTISNLVGVSRMTLYRRLNAGEVSVSRYANISNEQLDAIVADILQEFPNSGYRRVQGYLQARGYIIQQSLIRESVKRVDPRGVFQRTMSSRIIVRRKYFVKQSNDIWHVDTHLKLVRWKICVRGGIDGKSRLIVFLEADNNNRAVNNLRAFLSGVNTYGLPSRTRTDKGLENILIARYMLEQRGLNRGSHICGRSVHNQRIERLWCDVFYGLLANYYTLFSNLESSGLLNINNEFHIAILHYVFMPRINAHLQEFARGWNSHPLSTESNKTPQQLFLIHFGSIENNVVDERNITDWNCYINSENDVQSLFSRGRITFVENSYQLGDNHMERLRHVDVHRQSVNYGADIYEEVYNILSPNNVVFT